MPSFSYSRSLSSRFGNIDARGVSTQFIYFWDRIDRLHVLRTSRFRRSDVRLASKLSKKQITYELVYRG